MTERELELWAGLEAAVRAVVEEPLLTDDERFSLLDEAAEMIEAQLAGLDELDFVKDGDAEFESGLNGHEYDDFDEDDPEDEEP